MIASTAVAQTPVSLAVDARASANPSIAASGSFVAIAWSAATANAMDVYAALSRDGGKTFSAPVRVNDVPGDARVNSELPPRVALVASSAKGAMPSMVVVWTTKGAKGTRIVSARSTDGRTTFSAAKDVPGSDAEGSRGWESIAVDAKGHVVVMWLDHRDAGVMRHDSSKTTAPMPKTDPTEKAALSKLYFASLDGATSTELTKSVCYCCKTSLVASGNDIYGVWRNVYAGSQRDIAFTSSKDGGKTFAAPVKVSDDGWHIDGCPENGPALAVDASHRVHVVWPTPPDGNNGTPLGLFYASSRDAKTFGHRAQVPTRGAAAHGQIVIDASGNPVVAWDEIVNGTRRIALARVRANGNAAPSFTSIESPDPAADRGWPVLAHAGKETLVAWVAGSGVGNAIRVTRLP